MLSHQFIYVTRVSLTAMTILYRFPPLQIQTSSLTLLQTSEYTGPKNAFKNALCGMNITSSSPSIGLALK